MATKPITMADFARAAAANDAKPENKPSIFAQMRNNLNSFYGDKFIAPTPSNNTPQSPVPGAPIATVPYVTRQDIPTEPSPDTGNPAWANFKQAELAKEDTNGDGVIDVKDLPSVQTNPDTGETQFVFNEAQFQKMLANFTMNLINPNSNIDGAPQTKWTTYDTEAQAIQAQAAQQQEKDRALAALAAMKNS